LSRASPSGWDREREFEVKKFLKFEFWMMLLGFVVGVGLFYILSWEPWEFVSEVSGTPTQLIYDEFDYSDSYSFYVKTSDVLLYFCELGAKEKSCIQIDTNTFLPDSFLSCGKSDRTPPPVPGVVLTSLDIRHCIVDGHIDIQVIGLEDGSIWAWQYVDTVLTPLAPFYLGSFCSLIGMFLGAFFYGIQGPVRDDSPSKAKNDMKHPPLSLS
jgi:hypothetical protein